jgi:chitinase
MKKIIFSIPLFLAFIASSQAADRYVVGYFRSWSKESYPHTKIKYGALTHIAHAFIWPEKDGSLNVPDYFLYPDLVKEAHRNGLSIIVAIGGWGKAEGFGPMVKDPEVRANFVNNLVQFCLKHGYDGADLDWEYPGKSDKAGLAELVIELRKAFQKNKLKWLSAALPATDWRDGYDVSTLSKNLDWFGIMTYDCHGSWSKHAGHNAPLFTSPKDKCGSVDDSVNFWLNQKGMPSNKLCIGLPFYGRIFHASDLYKSGNGGGSITYKDALLKIKQGWEYHWDDISCVSYLQDPAHTELASYEDIKSIQHKVKYLERRNLKGVIIWALGHDDTGTSQPLLSRVGDLCMEKSLSGQNISKNKIK